MQFLFGVWVLPEAFVRGFLGDTSRFLFSYSASLGTTVDACMVLVGVFLRPLVPGSYLFGAVLPEECGGGFFWEMTSGWMPYSVPSSVRQWIHISVSLRVGLVARGVREILIFSGVEFRISAWFDSGCIFVSLRVGLVA